MMCEDTSGVPSIVVRVEETCPPPYEVIEDKIDVVDSKLEQVLAKLGGCPGAGTEKTEGDNILRVTII